MEPANCGRLKLSSNAKGVADVVNDADTLNLNGMDKLALLDLVNEYFDDTVTTLLMRKSRTEMKMRLVWI